MKGECNCSKVSFAVNSEIVGLYQCHCKLCQRQSGSTSNTATLVLEQNFEWLSGEQYITKWQKESGFSSHFCKICGSPVPNRLRDTHFYWIPMGSVDTCKAKVISHICCNSKASWDVLSDHVNRLDGMPDDIELFINSFQRKSE